MSENLIIKDLPKIFFENKFKIFGITSIFFLISLIYSFSASEVYESEAVLVLNDSSNQMPDLGGISAIAGINLSALGGESSIDDGIQVMRSYDLFKRFINRGDFFLQFAAAKNWDRDSNILIFDKNIFDVKSNKWVSKQKFSVNGRPSIQEIYKNFHRENLIIIKDQLSGHIILKMNHISPEVAKESLMAIIKEVNDYQRERDISTATRSISFLEKKLNENIFAEVRMGLSSLIQEQVKKVMIAEANEEYLFEILSSPYASETRVYPRRSVIILSSSLLGLLFSFLFFIFTNKRF